MGKEKETMGRPLLTGNFSYITRSNGEHPEAQTGSYC